MKHNRLVVLLILILIAASAPLAPPPVRAAPTPDPVAPRAACDGAKQDNNVWWSGLGHDSFDTFYRSPFGAVTTAQGAVHLRFRTCQYDVTGVRIRVWDDVTDTQSWVTMAWESNATDPVLGPVDYWGADLPIPASTTILYYFFEVKDGTDTDYYVDDDPKFWGGGWGAVSDGWDDMRSYQVTVYDPAYSTPDWMKNGIVYQLFPDRFRNGLTANDPVAGTGYIYGQQVYNPAQWIDPVCDPRDSGGPCYEYYSNNFYGGDLQGIIDQINAGYFDDLGVTVLYLNPILSSPSNHGYDTTDYFQIASRFGSKADYDALIAAAQAQGLTVLLDGVFNHTSSDSIYFDRYCHFDSSGNPNPTYNVSNGCPTYDDDSGACESPGSSYRSWYTFGPSETCTGCDQKYRSWWGYCSLPTLRSDQTAVRSLIWSNGTASVGPYWVNEGAGGWRLDVAADVDCGKPCQPANDYWEGFRSAVRAVDPTAAIIGEEWGDASNWLLGAEWDSVMNYRFRSAVLDWLFDGCSGNGCSGGTVFSDNDSNSGSSSGTIEANTVSQFDLRLKSIQEDYPPPAWYAMMNLLGSHDTNRILFLLAKISNDNATVAGQKLKLLAIFQYTYPGAPTIYYGDEVGVAADGVWDGTWWQDDPYNRAPYPWADQGGTPDTALLAHYQALGGIRNAYAALRTGDFQTLLTDDARQVYAYTRTEGETTVVVALNRRNAAQGSDIVLNVSGYANLPDDTVLHDVLNDRFYHVAGGQIVIPAADTAAYWGHILAPPGPTAVRLTSLAAAPAAGGVVVTWETASEHDNAGFFLYRSATLDDRGVPLNETIIPSESPGGGQGAAYAFLDATAQRGETCFYTLEDVDFFGRRTAHGPVLVTPWWVYLPVVGRP